MTAVQTWLLLPFLLLGIAGLMLAAGAAVDAIAVRICRAVIARLRGSRRIARLRRFL